MMTDALAVTLLSWRLLCLNSFLYTHVIVLVETISTRRSPAAAFSDVPGRDPAQVNLPDVLFTHE